MSLPFLVRTSVVTFTHGTEMGKRQNMSDYCCLKEEEEEALIPTLLDLPAKIFPFFSSTSLACMWWLTTITQWEPIIREYVCPYFPCSSLNSTWGGCVLLKLSRLPIRGSTGRWGGSRGPWAGAPSFRCRANKVKLMTENMHRHRNQSIPISSGV